MKKLILVFSTVLMALFATAAGKKVWVYSHSGNHVGFDISDFDSLSFVEPGFIELNPTEKHISSEGGRFSLGITANKSWTATVNDPAIILGATQGTGDANISVIALPNTDNQPYSGIITVTLVDGTYKQAIVTVAPNNASYTTETSVTDCQGNTYPVVKIGNQYWMAENLRCTKYDTESERAGAILTTTSNEEDYAPYYADAADKTKWDFSVELMENSKGNNYSINLSAYMISKLGCLYNWAAAVGLSSGSESISQTSGFGERRQGICPNGWHIPTDVEFNLLAESAGDTMDGFGDYPNTGKQLKSTLGWYSDEQYNTDCFDSYGFSALPAGSALGSRVITIGAYTGFWTTVAHSSGYAYFRSIIYYSDVLDSFFFNKCNCFSVRCVKN